MDNWENKIIADKLNSLQQLPLGYLPNLDAKWEIIEAGLPKRKNNIVPLFKWLVAAAVLVIVFCSINIFFFRVKNQVASQLSFKNSSTVILTTTLNQLKIKTFPLIKKAELKNKKNLAVNNNEILIADKVNQKKIIKTIIPVLNNIEIKPITQLQPISSITIIAATKTEIIKPVKTKVFQKDFVDDVLTMDKQFKTNNEHSGLKLQINKNAIGENGQSAPALQWQKSF